VGNQNAQNISALLEEADPGLGREDRTLSSRRTGNLFWRKPGQELATASAATIYGEP